MIVLQCLAVSLFMLAGFFAVVLPFVAGYAPAWVHHWMHDHV